MASDSGDEGVDQLPWRQSQYDESVEYIPADKAKHLVERVKKNDGKYVKGPWVYTLGVEDKIVKRYCPMSDRQDPQPDKASYKEELQHIQWEEVDNGLVFCFSKDAPNLAWAVKAGSGELKDGDFVYTLIGGKLILRKPLRNADEGKRENDG